MIKLPVVRDLRPCATCKWKGPAGGCSLQHYKRCCELNPNLDCNLWEKDYSGHYVILGIIIWFIIMVLIITLGF